MSNKVKAILLLCIFSLPSLLFAQAPPDFDEQVYDVAVPFDPGITILVSIGIIYGVIKVIEYRKSEKIKSQLSKQ